MKHNYEKSKFLEILSETPFISLASKKSGISRATIYRWQKDNPEFKKAVETSIKAGVAQIGEIAEMGLVKLLKETNLQAIKFYLTHNNQRYVPKRSEYVFPPNHLHYGEPDRCENCGRLSVEKELERRAMRDNGNEAIRKLVGSNSPKDKENMKKLMDQVLEKAKELNRKEKEDRGLIF